MNGPIATASFADHLSRRLRGEVDASARRRAEYSTDASNYRVVPAVVAFPRDVDDVLTALEVARAEGVPVTARGAGTSIAGNAVGTGLVLDLSRHVNGVIDVDPGNRCATVEPGAVLDALQARTRPHGLRFGPDPSTHARCTVGGMIGNNACGAHAVAWGRTADNVLALDVVDGTGRRFTAARGLDPVPGLSALVGGDLATLRTELGRFRRQVSGYSLEHLLPEHGADLAKALVGTEGTCVTVLGATVRLVEAPAHTALAVLGYPDVPASADAVPAILPLGPLAVEALDARIVDVVRRHKGAVPDLPRGAAWLLVETGGATPAEAEAAARAVAAQGDPLDSAVVTGARQVALWRIREDGAGLASRTADGEPAWPGWEDAAVPPERLGAYLREFEALLAEHRLSGLSYGHFGDGCVHVRLDLPLREAPQRLRPFLVDAAHLVARHGGSLSGEHGDGRARSDLLPIIYSENAIGLFAAFKHLLDPAGTLNPGVLVDPRPSDADLRLPTARPLPLARRPGGLALHADGGDVLAAVHRCTGVGKCRAPGVAGSFMCPSYLATADEKDTTRGRARVLQEMLQGDGPVAHGWASPEVHEALDLCLACKACARDCPTGVDMAAYKVEALHHRWRGRLRPRSHYALGSLPRWTALARRAPRLANAVTSVAAVAALVRAAGGVDRRRPLPRFATDGGAPQAVRRPEAPRVVLWADSFTAAFSPAAARAAATLLARAGYAVDVVGPEVCCGLTWTTTGRLDGARARLRTALDVLAPLVTGTDGGAVVVGVEPSCTASLRTDLPELLPDDPRSAVVAGAVRTLAEVLVDRLDAADLPDLTGVRVVAQPHCHQHAATGYAADLVLLRRAGAEVSTVVGCCGLAGSFGMEAGEHHDVSVAVAERTLLPALLAAGPDAVLLADGFSCRTQAEHLAATRATTLAELLTR